MLKKENLFKYFLVFSFALIFQFSSAQTLWQPQKYDGISPSKKTALFTDYFDDNSHKWDLGTNATINNGVLQLRAESGKISSNAKVIINENENFEIETSLKFVSGNAKRAFGIQWGKSKSGNRYFSFAINASGQFAISKYSGAYINYKQERESSLIKGNDYNKLTLRKVDNMAYFFLNEELVFSREYKLAYGNYIGFQSAGGNTVHVDYLVVKKLNNKVENKPPDIFINSPKLENTFVELDEGTNELQVSGKVKDEFPINSILIDNKKYQVQDNGNFNATIPLTPELKNIQLSVTDKQLQTSVEYINIKYLKKKPEVNNQTTEIRGTFHALIIAVNEYVDEGIIDLSGPISDAEKLQKILIDNYTFDKENVKLLKNPKRVDFIIALDSLSRIITEEDNLLIFYAGHGYWDFERKLGYWVPSDATWENTANWFRNSTLKSYIASINTRNILLISDACFAGGIFKSRAIFKNVPLEIAEIYNLPSRKAMTSGNLKEVPDRSEFLKYLCQRLNDNTEKFITAEKLFDSFKVAVMNNTPNEPQFGTIRNSGDQGGDFVFIRK